MREKSPKISIIIPVWDDRNGMLVNCLNSAVTQLYDNYEVLVVLDGGGTEKANEVLKQFAGVPNLRILKLKGEPSGTAVTPRNWGIKYASGDYVAFLDSDDIALPYRLATSMQYIGYCDMLYSDYIMDNNGMFTYQKSLQCDYNKMLTQNYVNFNTTLVKTEIAREIGGLRQEMKYCEDYAFILSLLYRGHRAIHIPIPLTVYRLHKDNLEQTFKKEEQKWLAMARENHKKFMLPIKPSSFEKDIKKFTKR